MKRKEKEYLVCIIDTISKYVRVKAKTKKGAENKINNGDWFDEDVEKEDVIDRQLEGVVDEWRGIRTEITKD